MNSNRQDDVCWEEAPVQALRIAINYHKASGTLEDFLDEDFLRMRPSQPELLGTQLHHACLDPDGERGESKIALLFQASFEAGLSPQDLAKKLAKTETKGVCGRHFWLFIWLTPLHLVARNPAATENALRMVCDAWPNALFTAASGGDYFSHPGNPLCYVMDDDYGDLYEEAIGFMHSVKSEVATSFPC